MNTAKAPRVTDAAEPSVADGERTPECGASVAYQARETPRHRRRWGWLLLAVLMMPALAGGRGMYSFARGKTRHTSSSKAISTSARSTSRSRSTAASRPWPSTRAMPSRRARSSPRWTSATSRTSCGWPAPQRDNLAAILAKLEHGSRPEEIAEARAQLRPQRGDLGLRPRPIYERGKELAQLPGRSARRTSTLAPLNHWGRRGERQIRPGVASGSPRSARAGRYRRRRAPCSATGAATIIQIERTLADSNLVAPSDGIILTRARETRGDRPGRRNGLHADARLAGLGAHLCQRARPGPDPPGMPAAVTTDSAPDRAYSAMSASSRRPPSSRPRPSRPASCAPTWSTGCAWSWTTPTAACGRGCRSPSAAPAATRGAWTLWQRAAAPREQSA